MKHVRLLLLFPCLLLSLVCRAQPPLTQWHHLDPVADNAMGLSTERAYALLHELGIRPATRPLLVAVIDGGVDTAHADLKAVPHAKLSATAATTIIAT